MREQGVPNGISIMAENESLDLGGPYSKRWDVPFEFVRKGASCHVVGRSGSPRNNRKGDRSKE
jgi:hypothetical protein